MRRSWVFAFVLLFGCGGSSPPPAVPCASIEASDASAPPSPSTTNVVAPAAASASSASAVNASASPDDAACAARGGKMERICMASALACVIDYKDAGKACAGKSDCTGQCLFMGNRVDVGTPVVGNCQPSSDPCGCRSIVDAGKVISTICTD